MEDELARFRRLYEEEKRRREHGQRLLNIIDDQLERAREFYEEEQRHREEERCRFLKSIEELTQELQPLTLEQYLESYHSLQLSIRIINSPSPTAKISHANPANRIFPRRIIPWGDDFAVQQEAMWDKINDQAYFSRPTFSPQHNVQLVKSYIKPLVDEDSLRSFERDVVEGPVQMLVDRLYGEYGSSSSLGLLGTVTFNNSHTDHGLPVQHPGIPQRKARGKGNRADQYCVHRISDRSRIPVLAIDYKTPRKLSREELITGLESEIRPERDVINKKGEGFAFAAKRLAATVVTQLFSYMVGKGIRYGYVCTGEAFVFLYIPDDDPTVVYHSLCIPSLDVVDGDETRLHRTAVGQVLAFTVHALKYEPPPMSWHDKTNTLGVWPVEYDDVLRDIPETVRKEAYSTPYKTQTWKFSLARGSGDKPVDSNGVDDNNTKSTPTESPQQTLNKRRFCTHKCLLGLVNGGPMDESCPNIEHHGAEHISLQEFRQSLHKQLAEKRGADSDCIPLYASGSLGSLFKVCLSSHGYTLVVKGMESLDLDRLQHENKVYDRLQRIQGKYVPVCLGIINLALPYYYNSGVFTHFMCLSWGGQPLARFIPRLPKVLVVESVGIAYSKLRKYGVLHCDAAIRNLLFNNYTHSFMVVDFERAKIDPCEELEPLGPYGERKRKYTAFGLEEDQFGKEFNRIIRVLSSQYRR